jgi:6-pyruvoyltetrahydropterin/6-carboxytetrahydropterin synthase
MIMATRSHEFCYGHRVFGHEGKCAHFHGHAGIAEFSVTPRRGLDGIGRVIDFSIIKALLCEWLEVHWDHRMLLWERDPALPKLRDMDSHVTGVPFNPTAENLANHLLTCVGPTLLKGTGARLIGVRFYETGKCWADAMDTSEPRGGFEEGVEDT